MSCPLSRDPLDHVRQRYGAEQIFTKLRSISQAQVRPAAATHARRSHCLGCGLASLVGLSYALFGDAAASRPRSGGTIVATTPVSCRATCPMPSSTWQAIACHHHGRWLAHSPGQPGATSLTTDGGTTRRGTTTPAPPRPYPNRCPSDMGQIARCPGAVTPRERYAGPRASSPPAWWRARS
jgi:hypothetical protein